MSLDTECYEKNLRDELDGSALYAALAAAETDQVRKDLFLQLSQAEAEHAKLWSKKLAAAGVDAQPAKLTSLLGALKRIRQNQREGVLG